MISQIVSIRLRFGLIHRNKRQKCLKIFLLFLALEVEGFCFLFFFLSSMRCIFVLVLLHHNQRVLLSVSLLLPRPSGATRGSAWRSVPGLRVWTEAGGPGPCGGSAAGPVGAVCPPP